MECALAREVRLMLEHGLVMRRVLAPRALCPRGGRALQRRQIPLRTPDRRAVARAAERSALWRCHREAEPEDLALRVQGRAVPLSQILVVLYSDFIVWRADLRPSLSNGEDAALHSAAGQGAGRRGPRVP